MLKNFINQIQGFILTYMTETQMNYFFKGMVLFFLFIAMLLIFYTLRKTKVLSKAITAASEQIDMLQHKKKTGQIINKHSEGKIQKLINKMDRKLKYSGLPRIFPFLNTETAIIIVLGSMAGVLFLIQFIGHDFFYSLIGMGIILAFYIGLESFLSFRNYIRTEQDLLVFLNTLKNYSISADEITLILYRTGKYLHEPLRSVMEECYNESNITGNSIDALDHLIDKIEHPKFKELIYSIKICSYYEADYVALLADQRKMIQNFIASRQEQKTQNRSDLIYFGLIAFAGLILLYAMGTIVKTNLLLLLVTTETGNKFAAALIGIIIVFIWKVALFDKD